MKDRSLHLDLLGMIASLVCAIHCAALPLLIGMTTVGSVHILADPLIEHIVLYFSLSIAFLSLIYSYINHHGRTLPIFMAGLGFILIIGVHLLFETQYFILAGGGLLVAAAHLINYQWTKSCATHPIHEARE